MCTLFSPLSSTLPPSHHPLSTVHPSPHLLFSYSLALFISFPFLSFPFLSFPFISFPFLFSPLLSSPSSLFLPPPSSLLQSLARCLVHATVRSWLTDGWTARAEAVRQWTKWNRTGPIHYLDSRLCLIFNLYFPGAGWQRTCCMFDWNYAHFASEVPKYFELFCALSLHQAACHILGRWSAIKETFLGGCFFLRHGLTHVCWGNRPLQNVTASYETNCCCDAASVLSTQLEQKVILVPSLNITSASSQTDFCRVCFFWFNWEKHLQWDGPT